MRVAVLPALALYLLAACGDDDGASPDAGAVVADSGPADAGVDAMAEPFRPDRQCPGEPGCEDVGDGVLHAAAAAVAITPVIDDTTEILLDDVNMNRHYDPEEGDTFRDTNGNGSFEGVWIAGYRNGRAATGVSDDQWARALVLRENETTIALVVLDVVGFFYDEALRIREALSDADVDYVMVASTHTHEAKDTIGIWGRSPFETGLDPEYQTRVREAAQQAVRDAVAALTPVNVQYASFDLRDAPGGTLRYVSDSRHPRVLDDEVRVLRFVDASDPTVTVSTLVNFGAHPEYAGASNQLLSSDFPHWLRQSIEEGVAGPDGTALPGVGGVAVFVNGAIGAQIGPNEVQHQAWDGTTPESGIPRAQNTGEQLGWLVLSALADGAGATTEETARLAFRTRSFYLDVQNTKYHFAAIGGLFSRTTYNWDEDRPISATNEPDVLTEIAVVDIGRAQFLVMGGELDPQLYLGGYDGAYTPDGAVLVDPSIENAPDLSMAPPGPYLRDFMREDATMHGFFGLTNDFLGYFIPSFDYLLASPGAYFDEPPGEHYEETNSLGPDAWPRAKVELEALLAWPDAP